MQPWTLLQLWTLQEFQTSLELQVLSDLSSRLESVASLELWVPLALRTVLTRTAFPGLYNLTMHFLYFPAQIQLGVQMLKMALLADVLG